MKFFLVILLFSFKTFSQNTYLMSVNGTSYTLEDRPDFREDLVSITSGVVATPVRKVTLDREKIKNLSEKNVEVSLDILATSAMYNSNVVVYFTDHGDRDANESSVIIGSTKLTKNDYQTLLKKIKKKRPDLKIISVFDTCYSGGMISASLDLKDPESSCAFSGSLSEEVAYGEETIAKLLKSQVKPLKKTQMHSFAEVLDSASNEARLSTLDSTSKYYLRHYLEKYKSQKKLYSKTVKDLNTSCPKNLKNIAEAKRNLEIKLLLDNELKLLDANIKKLKENQKDRARIISPLELSVDINRIDEVVKHAEYLKSDIKAMEKSQAEYEAKLEEDFMKTWPKFKEYDACSKSIGIQCSEAKLKKYLDEFQTFRDQKFENYKHPNIEEIETYKYYGLVVSETLNHYNSIIHHAQNLQALQLMMATKDTKAMDTVLALKRCENTKVLRY